MSEEIFDMMWVDWSFPYGSHSRLQSPPVPQACEVGAFGLKKRLSGGAHAKQIKIKAESAGPPMPRSEARTFPASL